MRHLLTQWLVDEDGLSTVEYALLVAVVAVASIGAWVGLAQRLRLVMATTTNEMSGPPR